MEFVKVSNYSYNLAYVKWAELRSQGTNDIITLHFVKEAEVSGGKIEVTEKPDVERLRKLLRL